MRRSIFLILLCASAATGCAGGNPVTPSLPSMPSTPLAPAPTPRFAFSEPFTEMSPNQTVSRHVSANGPECTELPGWNCHYFRITASSDGTLDVRLSWVLETQPTQPLDLSLEKSNGADLWSGSGPGPQSRLRFGLVAGETYQITVWYLFIGVDYELQSSFQPH